MIRSIFGARLERSGSMASFTIEMFAWFIASLAVLMGSLLGGGNADLSVLMALLGLFSSLFNALTREIHLMRTRYGLDTLYSVFLLS